MPFLPPETLDFRDGHPADAELQNRILDIFQFERFDDGFNLLHMSLPYPLSLIQM